jgi:hypothetical protein
MGKMFSRMPLEMRTTREVSDSPSRVLTLKSQLLIQLQMELLLHLVLVHLQTILMMISVLDLSETGMMRMRMTHHSPTLIWFSMLRLLPEWRLFKMQTSR